MPFHLNVCHLSGTMTRDPEISYTPKGTAVCSFSLAINRVWKDGDGAKHEDTTFVEFTAFGRTAEVISEYCFKGHTIMVEGRLKLDQWEDKETGKKRSKLTVICEQFHFVSKPKDEDDRGEAPPKKQQSRPAPPQYRKPAPQQRDPVLDEADEDDIPF